MINNCNINDINRIIELGKLINDNFDKLNNLEEIIKNKEIIGYYIDNKLVGFIIFKTMYEITDLLYIVVDKLYRRKNIASKLLEELIGNSEKVMLEVRCDNDNAIKLYNEKINRPNSKISKRCCDFKFLEKKCKEYRKDN